MFTQVFWETFILLVALGWIGLFSGLFASLAVAAHAAPENSTHKYFSNMVLSMFLQGCGGIPILVGLGLVLNNVIGMKQASLGISMLSNSANWHSVLVATSAGAAIGVMLGILRLLIGPALNVSARVGVLWAIYNGFYDELAYRWFGISLFFWLTHIVLGGVPLTYLPWIAIAGIAIVGVVNSNSAFGIARYLISITPLTGSQRARSGAQILLSSIAYGWLFWHFGIEAAIVAHLCCAAIAVLRRSSMARFSAESIQRLGEITREIASASTLTEKQRIIQREQTFLSSGITPFVLSMEENSARKKGAEQTVISLDAIKVVFGRYYLERILDPSFAPQIEPISRAETLTEITSS